MANGSPTIHGSSGNPWLVGTGAGLDMAVLPPEATGHDATFRIAFLNQSYAPAVIALSARDHEDGLRYRFEPPDPVIVPPGATTVLAAVHVVPKAPQTGEQPHPYDIEVRGLPQGSEDTGSAPLVAQACFTYLPRSPRGWRPRRLRARSVGLVLLWLVLLLVIVFHGLGVTSRPTTTPSPGPAQRGLNGQQPRPTVTRHAVRLPSIPTLIVVHTYLSDKAVYELIWQTRDATQVTLDGRPVAGQGSLVLPEPPPRTTYYLVASNSAGRATAQARAVVDMLPRVVTFALHAYGGRLFVRWQVQNALYVTLQGVQVSSRGERAVPRGASVLRLVAGNYVGSEQRLLRLPRLVAASVAGHGSASAQTTLVLNPSAVDFGHQGSNTTGTAQVVHIVNLGPMPLRVTGIVIVGAPDAFTEADTCRRAAVKMFDGCTISVRFSPKTAGTLRSSLVIADNAAGSPQTIPLSGQG